jgi:nephrocystin-3
VLNNRRMKGRAFFYFRSSGYAKTKGGDYVPVSPEDRDRQRDLKRRIQASGYPVVGYRDPAALAKRLERDLWKLLDAEFPATSVPDAFEREAMRHEAYAMPRRRLYLGGERYQAQLASALESGEQRVIIEGASGGGKSALLANFFEGYRKRHPKRPVHEHYLGASADAGDPHALVRRLCEFIKRQTNSGEEIEFEPQKLMDSLPLWLATASAWARKRKTRFVFVLDALNSLTDQQDLRWWPAFLPQGVHFVVSCLPGPVLQALKAKAEGLQGQSPRWKVITVKPLTKAERKNLLTTYLTRFNKTLSRDLTQQVMAHPLSGNPLFIRTLAEELRLFGVHEELTKRLAHYLKSQTIDDLFEKVIDRVEGDCGKKAVKATLTAIWASRTGLTEKEIVDSAKRPGISNLKPAEWAPIRNSLDEALLEVEGKITFAHDYVRIAVRDRYLPTEANRRSSHRKLAQWFRKQPADGRRAEEEPWQLQAAGDEAALLRCLGEHDLFMAMHEHRGTLEIASYWLSLEATGTRRLEPFMSRRWSKWVQNLDERAQRLASDGVVELLVHAGCLSRFTLKLARLGLDLARLDRSVGRAGLIPYINMLAVLLKDCGRYGEAEPLYQEALALARRLGPSHRESLSTRLNNLAVFYRHTDRLKLAEELYRESLAISTSLLGPNSKSTATTMSNLVPVLRLTGRLSLALEMIDRAIVVLRRVDGDDAPALVILLNNRGQVLKTMQRRQQAEACFLRAVKLGNRCLGPAHPNVALVLNNLSELRLELDDYPGAAAAATEAIEIRRRMLPPEHPDIGTSLLTLGDCARHVGDRIESNRYYREAAVIYQAAGLKEDEARVYNLLGTMAHDDEDLSLAEEHYRRALGLLHQIGHDDSQFSLVLLNNMAMLLKSQGQLSGALTMARRALTLRQRLYPQRLDKLAISISNVGNILEAMGDSGPALRHYRRSLKLREKIFGPTHEELLDELVSIGTLMAEGDQPEEGVRILRRALKIAQERLGTEHTRTGMMLYHLGGVLGDLGAIDEAEQTMRQEIQIAKNIEGERSDSVRISLRRLGVLLRDAGRLGEAQAPLEEALSIAVHLHSPDSAKISPELSALGKLRADQGHLLEAQELFERALELLRAAPDSEPDAIARLSERLDAVINARNLE